MKDIACVSMCAAVSAFLLRAVAGVPAGSDVPRVSDVDLVQDGGRVTIMYTLSGSPGIVTMDIQTNTMSGADGEWASIGIDNFRPGEKSLEGPVFRLVRELGKTNVVWYPKKSWDGRFAGKGRVRAVVTAWATNAPPRYMVVPLAAKSPTRYFEDAVPGGITNREYKTTSLLMRKVDAACRQWKMGYPYCYPHDTLLTQDYYLGIYELTQGQATAMEITVKGSKWGDWETLPNAYLSYDNLRGVEYFYACENSAKNGHQVEPNSVIDKLRKKYGVTFDLPSQAQWEYAARAGVTGQVPKGSRFGQAWLTQYAWCTNNAVNTVTNKDTGAICEAAIAHPVGLLKPNDWGFYDMLGNMSELCLDPGKDNTTFYRSEAAGVDPYGMKDPGSATNPLVLMLGGNYKKKYSDFTNTYSYYGSTWGRYEISELGVRLWAPAAVGWE